MSDIRTLWFVKDKAMSISMSGTVCISAFQFFRDTSDSLYHAGAACATGRLNNTDAVADTRPRFIGVQNPREFDLSAVPFNPPAINK